MNVSPERGVVDAFGQVHGTANLFVASSSVVPTGGFGNVTLTAVALALRTADRLLAVTRRPIVETIRTEPDAPNPPDRSPLGDPVPG